MYRDPKDPNIWWVTEEELNALARPKRWWWTLIGAAALGLLAAQILSLLER